MEMSKVILNLIEKRRKYGQLANKYDGMVQQWCKKHNINDAELTNSYGCMLTTEPDVYAIMTTQLIKES
ncbi:MAG: hypothetical protein AB7G87_01395 [Clostridia bacterium]